MLADILTEDRWTKGSYFGNGKLCLGAALRWNPINMLYVGKAIEQLFPERYLRINKTAFEIMNFNDHPQTVLQDVLKVRRQADELKDLDKTLSGGQYVS